MKAIPTHQVDRTQGMSLTPEPLDPRNFQLHAAYIRRHGYPRRPLSTLTPDCRMQIESTTSGVQPE